MRVSVLIMAFLPPFSVDLGLISPGSGVLALGLQQLLVLLKVHGQVLFSTELISQAGSINHGTSSLILRQFCFSCHFIQISLELAELILELPLSSSDGLILIGQVSKSLIGVGQLLLSSAALAVSSLQKSAAFLQGILHGSSLAVSCNLGISSLGLQGRLLINLSLGITDLQGILLHCSSGLSISSNGLLQGETKLSCITLQLLPHPKGFSLALGLCLKGSLHGVQDLSLVFLHHKEFFILFSKPALNLSSYLRKLDLEP